MGIAIVCGVLVLSGCVAWLFAPRSSWPVLEFGVEALGLLVEVLLGA
jgi:hypothetical protein